MQGNSFRYCLLRAAQALIIALTFWWIGAQFSTFMDWSGVAQWLFSGLILLAGLQLAPRLKWQYWVLVVLLFAWSIAVSIILYAVAVRSGPPADDQVPAWVQAANPVLVAGVPVVIVAIAVLVVPMFWQRKKR